MSDLLDLLDQIDRLDQEAAKGPWEVWPQTDDEGVTYPEYIEGPKNDLYGERGWDDKHYIQEIPEMTMDDAEFIASARTFAPSASKALRAVMELHTRHAVFDGVLDFCPVCVKSEGATYPCATVRAITDAMEGDNETH